MSILRNMAMAVMAAPRIPNSRVSIVPTGVLPVLRRLRRTIGPNRRDTVGLFDPTAQSCNVAQSCFRLRPVRESYHLNLDCRVLVGLHTARGVSERSRSDSRIDVLINFILVDSKVRVGVMSAESIERTPRAAPFRRMVDNLEWATGIASR